MRDARIYDAAIVGAGPAGLNAALILGRTCRTTLVLDDGRPRNAVADRMHGFLTRDGTPPHEMLALARSELQRYESVTLLDAHVEAIAAQAGAFTLRTDTGSAYAARRVLLATGVYDALPAIEGLREAWGRTAFVCPYCDGWEMRGRRIAVVGKGGKAVELAQELRQWSRDLLICMQGEDALSAEHRRWIAAVGAAHVAHPIRRIRSSGGCIEALEFESGVEERCEAMFLSAPLRPRYPLVDMLGCKLRDDGEIDVDARGRTSVRGVYAAGDAVTTVHQVILAAASGVCAAMAMSEDALQEDVRAKLA